MHSSKRLSWRMAPVLITLAYTWVVWWLHNHLSDQWLVPLKLYPVAMNLAMLIFFGSSLIFTPTVIERIARVREPHLPAVAILYTRRVTQVWCLFFVINGALALFTTLFASPALWALYNGVIAYLLMAILFGCEYAVRLRFKRRHDV